MREYLTIPLKKPKVPKEETGLLISYKMIRDFGMEIAYFIGAIKGGLNIHKYYSYHSRRHFLIRTQKLGLVKCLKVKRSINEKEIIKIIKKKKPQKIEKIFRNFNIKKCDWCGGTSFALDGHHLKNGELVYICGSCHREYHELERQTRSGRSYDYYKLTKKAEKYYKYRTPVINSIDLTKLF